MKIVYRDMCWIVVSLLLSISVSYSYIVSVIVVKYIYSNRPKPLEISIQPTGILIDGIYAHRTLWLISHCLNNMASTKPHREKKRKEAKKKCKYDVNVSIHYDERWVQNSSSIQKLPPIITKNVDTHTHNNIGRFLSTNNVHVNIIPAHLEAINSENSNSI